MHDGHDHSHSHGYSTGEYKEVDKTKLLLKFTLDHNIQHAAELKALEDKLEKESRIEAARLIRESIVYYESGNKKIEEALGKL